MKAVRIGMIGIGHIAIHSHLPPLSEMVKRGEVIFQAFCDVNEESAREQAEVFGVENVYTDHHEMFDREELDAVYLCIPPTLHNTIAIATAHDRARVNCETPAIPQAAATHRGGKRSW